MFSAHGVGLDVKLHDILIILIYLRKPISHVVMLTDDTECNVWSQH